MRSITGAPVFIKITSFNYLLLVRSSFPMHHAGWGIKWNAIIIRSLYFLCIYILFVNLIRHTPTTLPFLLPLVSTSFIICCASSFVIWTPIIFPPLTNSAADNLLSSFLSRCWNVLRISEICEIRNTIKTVYGRF